MISPFIAGHISVARHFANVSRKRAAEAKTQELKKLWNEAADEHEARAAKLAENEAAYWRRLEELQ